MGKEGTAPMKGVERTSHIFFDFIQSATKQPKSAVWSTRLASQESPLMSRNRKYTTHQALLTTLDINIFSGQWQIITRMKNDVFEKSDSNLELLQWMYFGHWNSRNYPMAMQPHRTLYLLCWSSSLDPGKSSFRSRRISLLKPSSKRLKLHRKWLQSSSFQPSLKD